LKEVLVKNSVYKKKWPKKKVNFFAKLLLKLLAVKIKKVDNYKDTNKPKNECAAVDAPVARRESRAKKLGPGRRPDALVPRAACEFLPKPPRKTSRKCEKRVSVPACV
jgi:hypothetical protein